MPHSQHSTIIKNILFLLFVLIVASQEIQSQYLRAVWVYVEDISDMNQLQKLCLQNIKHYTTTSKYEYRLITDQNLSKYLNVSDIIKQIQNSTLLDKDILKRGLVQLSILKQYGGIWVDLPSMMVETFEWIETLKNQKHVNNRIDNPEAIMFYTPELFEPTYKRTSGKIQDLVVYPKYQTWFVIIKEESQFIRDWKKMYIQIAKKPINDLKSFYVQNNLSPQDFLINPKDFLRWTARATISIKQAKLDQQYGTSSSRRLAISYYKVTGINSEQSAYLLSTQARSHTHLTAKYFAQVPLASLKQNFTYLLRMPQKVKEEIVTLVDQNIPMTQHLHTSVQLVCDGSSIPYRHIVVGSVIDAYLLKISPSNKVETYSSEFIAHNCSVTYESVLYEFLLGYILPILGVGVHVYIVRRMILIFKPEWGVRRRIIA